MLGRKLTGKPDRRVVYGKTRGHAQKKLDELRNRKASGFLGDAKDERSSLAAFITRWLDAKRATVWPRTHERYAQLMRVHVVPALGTVKVAALRPDALERLHTAKLAGGLSPRTVQHIHTVAHTALKDALRWGYVPRNVADAVTPPRVPRHEMQVPSAAELGVMLAAAEREGDRFRALWVVASYTGMRLGELLGLTWEYVDLARGAVSVQRIRVGVKDLAPIWGEPKTSRSRRDVPLSAAAVAALKAHYTRQLEERLAVGGELRQLRARVRYAVRHALPPQDAARGV